MEIKGLGIDIEEVARFRKLPYSGNKDFYAKIFSEKEIEYCLAKKDPYPNFSARFSAKEAIIKATSGKISDMKKIEIINNADGSPKANIKNLKGKILISLSHTKNQAIAIAIWLN